MTQAWWQCTTLSSQIVRFSGWLAALYRLTYLKTSCVAEDIYI